MLRAYTSRLLRNAAAGRAFMSSSRELVSIPWSDLADAKDCTADVMRAYGADGLGALVISGIPGYAEARRRLIPLSHKIAHLPEEDKRKLEHEPSMYNVGWSHGKEKLGDTPDFAKGSFYANPVNDSPGTDEMREKYPFFYPKNIWPSETIPEMEPAVKELGTIMHSAVANLAKQVDMIVEPVMPGYPKGLMHHEMSNTMKVKGRVLYYYPNESKADQADGWIGWHNDSGFFTALTSDMFFDDETGEVIPSPDPEGGLWIVDRGGGSVKVDIPEDSLAVQCGECLQIVTGGMLVATPHCVKASKPPPNVAKVGRGTFPVFIDTGIDFPLSAPQGVVREQVFAGTMDSRVPPLQERWLTDGTPFGEFLGNTFQKYYEHSMAGK